MRTDRQTDAVPCGMLWNALDLIEQGCGPLRYVVDCGALRKRCEGLQMIVVLYGACGASSAPCGGVHQILSPLYSGTLPKRYRKLTDHGNACGPLWCVAVHYGVFGALRKRCGSLVDHWNASKLLQFTTTHCGASSARCGGVHHTLMETPKFHLPPLHPADPQKPIDNP